MGFFSGVFLMAYRREGEHCTNVRLWVLASAVAETLPHTEAAKAQHHAWVQTSVPVHTHGVPEHHGYTGRFICHLQFSLK